MRSLKQQDTLPNCEILSRFPNYQHAKALPEIHASQLTREVFLRDYVAKNQPVVIREASAHWAKLQLWSLEYIREKMKDVSDFYCGSGGLLDKPMREYAGKTIAEESEIQEKKRPQGPEAHADRFFQRILAGEKLTAYGVASGTPGLESLLSDIESFPYFGNPLQQKSHFYHPRLFFYQGGYTDWHFHYGDETLTLQALGTKEMLLLGTDTATFEAMWKVARNHGMWEVKNEEWPELQKLVPYRARLEANDAIYIPVFWWHAVEPCYKEFGVTAAFTFASPLTTQFDLRLRAVRWNLMRLIEFRDWKLIATFIPLALWAILRHPFRW